MTERASTESLLSTAGNAIAAMRNATAGKQEQDSASTDVSTLLALTRLLDAFSTVVAQRQRAETEVVALVGRIANLQVRGGPELIEQGNWKRVCAELQDIALQALKLISHA